MHSPQPSAPLCLVSAAERTLSKAHPSGARHPMTDGEYPCPLQTGMGSLGVVWDIARSPSQLNVSLCPLLLPQLPVPGALPNKHLNKFYFCFCFPENSTMGLAHKVTGGTYNLIEYLH